jgi:hypothetical protein
MKSLTISFAIMLTLCLITSASWAGWSTTSLHPSDDYFFSNAFAVSGGQVGGMAVVDRNGKVFHPAEWATPTKAGFTDLYDNIPGAVYAVGGGVQAGNTHTFAVW